MSVSYRFKTVIGVEVRREDFMTVEQIFAGKCPTHGAISGKYCADCGQAAMVELNHVPTDALMALCAATDAGVDEFYGDEELHNQPDAFNLHVVDEVWGDGSPEHHAFGLVVAKSDDLNYSSSDVDAMTIAAFMNIYKKARKLVTDCGFDPLDIKLYHCAQVG